MIPPLSFLRQRALCHLAALAAVLSLAGCGGGGGGDAASPAGSTTVTPTSLLAPSASLAGVCSLPGEKAFARSYLDESYLWWDRIAPVNSEDHLSLESYFNALLVRTPDARGRPTDRFSTVTSASRADALLSASSEPAAGVLATSGYAVPLASTLASPGGRTVGYVLFNRHGRGAQDALITAFEALRSAQVQDLVLDLRHNPGGYLYVAQTVASMVAGPERNGQVFEQLRYSDKRAAQGAGSALRFIGAVRTGETRYPAGYPLPQLALPRLYVLASGITCSASESIVNGLRGVGIEVVLVGDTTCGKPYGFHRSDNCGKSYFAIEFQGVNAAGFGDYGAGFAPQCPVAEDATAALGDAREPLLAAALNHIDTGSCPAAEASGAPAAPKRRSAADPHALAGRLLLAP